jgi:hypothetical protein
MERGDGDRRFLPLSSGGLLPVGDRQYPDPLLPFDVSCMSGRSSAM